MFFSIINFLSELWFFALHIGGDSTFLRPLTKAEEEKCLQILQCSKCSANCAETFSAEEIRAARDKLICHNMRLVAHVIKKYYANYSDQDDLISIGTIGLIKGINSFDNTKGVKLATYAARCIENEILMHFRTSKAKQQHVLLGEAIDCDSEGNPLTIMDVICDDINIEDDIEEKIKVEKALDLINDIDNERDKQIIIYRFGLFGTIPLTQREVAKKLGISRSYVSRIEKRVLEDLKNKLLDEENR